MRPIRFLELASINGWRVKTYGISAEGETPSLPLVQTAKRLAGEALPTPPVRVNGNGGSDDGYGPFDSLDRCG